MGNTSKQDETGKKVIITAQFEEILKAVYFYRYITALDIAYLLYSPKSLTRVRTILANLAGGKDYVNGEYLYRFVLPSVKAGNRERIYTLGSKGRDFLQHELGMEVNWYFRPERVRHLSYSQVLHSLILTRFLVAAKKWTQPRPDYKIGEVKICYELGAASEVNTGELRERRAKMIPDGWIKFERLRNREHHSFLPVLLEIDRGMEFRESFKRHITGRIESIRSGEYLKLFWTEAVTVVYVTTGEFPEYRESRCKSMCAWTKEVLAELHKENWVSIFRFTSVVLEEMYTTPLFDGAVWYRPDADKPVTLFPVYSLI